MKKILVIEDDFLLLNDVVSILEMENFEVISASDGLAGLQQAKRQLPDVIICDILMPEMDGYMVLLEIRSDPITSGIPFIFLTARTQRPEIRRGMELGADDYLTKPFTPPELLASIETRLKRREILTEEYTSKISGLRSTMLQALPTELEIPLDGILKYAKVLTEDYEILPPNQIFQLAQGIDRAALRMHRLTENYLVYVQLEMIATNPVRQAALYQQMITNPCEVIKTVVTRKMRDADRSADLVWTCENSPVQISAESLTKIAEEILDNALHFSTTGTPVEVKLSLDDQYFTLTITDKGEGITSEHLAILNQDAQLPAQSATLGLLIVKRLAKLHGGLFKISSEQGTTVTIQLWRSTPSQE